MQSETVETEAKNSLLPYILTPQQAYDALTSSTSSFSSSATPGSSGRTIPISAAWFWPEMPFLPRDYTGLESFTKCHIPRSIFWDFENIRDKDSELLYMMPSAASLASVVHALGIVRTDRLIIYDSAELGLFTAPRVAWMLRTFGIPNVHVLDSFPLWIQQGLPIESGPPPPALEHPAQISSSHESAENWPGSVVTSFDEIRALSQAMGTKSADAQLIDSRFEHMFHGQVSDFITRDPSGHVPNSLNVPYDRLCDPSTRGLRSTKELTTLFESCGVARELPAVSMCHVGITAVVLDMALEKAGFGGKREGRKIYDGSFT